jgi:phenylacetate-CoA ligase
VAKLEAHLPYVPYRVRRALFARQLRRLDLALACAARFPGYRDALRALPSGLDPAARLARLPLLERRDLQADPDAYRDRTRPSITIHTSGSVGTPLTYYLDRRARLRRLASYARFNARHGWLPWHRSLSLKVLPDSSDRVGSAWLDRTLLGRRRVASVLDPPEVHLRILQETDPNILHGTASALEQLALEAEKSGRKPGALRRIFTASEAADAPLRRHLERALGAPVVDHYGAAEGGLIGWECELRDGYHVNMPSVFLEILDEAGRPAPPGQAGRVVITTLDNPAMPLLRYAIGDYAIQGNGSCCPCGRPEPILPRVLGRAVDTFLLPSGPKSAWAAVARMREIEGLLRFQLIQADADRIVARVQSIDSRWPVHPKRVADLVRKTLGEELRVEVVETDRFSRLPSGKFAPALRRWNGGSG